MAAPAAGEPAAQPMSAPLLAPMPPPLNTRCWVDDIPEHPPKARAKTTSRTSAFFIRIFSSTLKLRRWSPRNGDGCYPAMKVRGESLPDPRNPGSSEDVDIDPPPRSSNSAAAGGHPRPRASRRFGRGSRPLGRRRQNPDDLLGQSRRAEPLGAADQDHFQHRGVQLAGILFVIAVHLLDDLLHALGFQFAGKGLGNGSASAFGGRRFKVGQVADTLDIAHLGVLA